MVDLYTNLSNFSIEQNPFLLYIASCSKRALMKKNEVDFSAIAVDMGAGSIRVMLATRKMDVLAMDEIHRIKNEIRVRDGRDTWDMEQITRDILWGIAKAIDAAPLPPLSVGVDSWGVDFVLLDINNELVETPVAYRDKRTAGMQDRWGKLMSEYKTFSRTGINFYIFNTLYQLLSMKGSKALQRTSRILFVPSYINYLLTGEAVNELSIASTSQMLAVKDSLWDEQILEKLDLEQEKLGKLIPSGTKLGSVKHPSIGNKDLECVAVCGHDTACVVAALPVENPNFAFISAGTWCIVGIESSQPLISEEAFQLGITNERGFGNTYRPLKNIVGLWLLQGLKKQSSTEITFAQMEALVQGEGDVLQVIDPDDPGFYNPENMKLAFDAYFKKTGQPLPLEFSSYIRCAYDSLCFSFRYQIEQLEKLSFKPIEVLHVVGGGSQSDYLCQRIATICEREVISGPVEGAAMGNVLIQGMAMGKIKSIQAGRDLVRRSCQVKRYRPETLLSITKKRYKTYLALKNSIA
jgi:rhamnulokinase